MYGIFFVLKKIIKKVTKMRHAEYQIEKFYKLYFFYNATLNVKTTASLRGFFFCKHTKKKHLGLSELHLV